MLTRREFLAGAERTRRAIDGALKDLASLGA
jgi:hypothetical protein